jgi:hypothetical protein
MKVYKEFHHEKFNRLIEDTTAIIRSLSSLKGGEYSGDSDRLANFRRNATDLELPMETVWRIYAAKHWDAIGQYIKDIQSGKTRIRLEGIDGRVDDLIVYLLLFKAMYIERSETNGEYTGRVNVDPGSISKSVIPITKETK